MLASSEQQQQQVNNATLRFFTTVSVEFIGVKIPFCVVFFFQTAAAVNVKLTAAGNISYLYNLFPVLKQKTPLWICFYLFFMPQNCKRT